MSAVITGINKEHGCVSQVPRLVVYIRNNMRRCLQLCLLSGFTSKEGFSSVSCDLCAFFEVSDVMIYLLSSC